VLELWHAVTGGFPEEILLDELDFLASVDRHMFPLDEDWINDAYSAEENPLDGPIQYLSYGLPWEVQGTKIDACAVPLLGTFYHLLTVEPGLEDGLDDLESNVERWREEHFGALDIPEEFGTDIAVYQKLVKLEEPFNGLAVVWEMLTRDSGNIFIDSVPPMYHYEYDMTYDYNYYWEPECMRDLIRLYQNVKADIDKVIDYKTWFENAPHAVDKVTELLCKTFSITTDYSEEDGDGYDD
jgi:hypothetical protein